VKPLRLDFLTGCLAAQGLSLAAQGLLALAAQGLALAAQGLALAAQGLLALAAQGLAVVFAAQGLAAQGPAKTGEPAKASNVATPASMLLNFNFIHQSSFRQLLFVGHNDYENLYPIGLVLSEIKIPYREVGGQILIVTAMDMLYGMKASRPSSMLKGTKAHR
jgi:hypothetical protein